MARKAFAHDAVVTTQDDPDALGGAVTVLLCGGWDHRPPCPLAPHFVSTVADGETVAVRVVFATEPENEQRVRGLIGEALATGRLTVPDGGVAFWELQSASTGSLRDDEEELAASLVAHWGAAVSECSRDRLRRPPATPRREPPRVSPGDSPNGHR